MPPIILILGSNSDVGQACAYRFAEEGCALILATRRQDDDQAKLAADLRIRYEVSVNTVSFDAHLYDTHPDFYAALRPQPDIVLTVIGYLGDQKKASQDFLESKTIISANYSGQVSILNIVAQAMAQRSHGTIIGLSSVAGERGRASNYLYGSAKAGFTAYLSGLRQAMYPAGVHVATIIPGFIQTKMLGDLKTPAILTATPAQVATVVWKAYAKKQNLIYVLPVWRWIMLIIRLIPDFIFKRLKL